MKIILAATWSCVLVFSSVAFTAPKEIYTDPETNREVWRMTNYSGVDLVQYYHHPTMSPNGRYLIFRTSRVPFIYLMTSDGVEEKPIGDWSVWNNARQVDFSSNNLQGWWSHDSRFYYTFAKLYVIDIEKFRSNLPADQYISQISDTYANAFYYPLLSPDGRRLFGLANSNDVDSGGSKLKLINIDGTNYQELDPPFDYYSNGAIDVSHGWLGNSRAWYMNRDPVEYKDIEVVFDTTTGSYSGILEVTVPGGDMWDGLFDHPTFSPSAYFIGEGEGRIGGFGRGLLSANTKYWSQDPTERQLVTVGPAVAPHPNFSPDGRWIVIGDTESSNKGLLLTYPVPPNTQPLAQVARFRDAAAVTGSQEDSAYATFSPDGTKIIFRGYLREASNSDVYMAIFKAPDAPTALTVTRQNDTQVLINWKPAALHREIKEYEIWKADSIQGTYQKIATVAEILTHLEVSSKLGAGVTTIQVDSTVGFPDQGAIEIAGMSSELPNELVSYISRTQNSFEGCARAALGTSAAEHWNDAFVWSYTGVGGQIDALVPGSYYKIRSIEWSGLIGAFSDPATLSGVVDNVPPMPPANLSVSPFLP